MVVSQPCSSHYASMHQPRSQQDPHMPKRKAMKASKPEDQLHHPLLSSAAIWQLR
jgi:hypothetical protein